MEEIGAWIRSVTLDLSEVEDLIKTKVARDLEIGDNKGFMSDRSLNEGVVVCREDGEPLLPK